MRRASYFARLCDELAEHTKRTDVTVDAGHRLVVAAALPRSVDRAALRIFDLFAPAKWESANCAAPRLAYFGHGKLLVVFQPASPASVNLYVAATSSVVTNALAAEFPDYVCTCTATQIESQPVLFAYLMVEIDSHYRERLAAAVGQTTFDHLTTSELEAARRGAGPIDRPFGVFFRPKAQGTVAEFAARLSPLEYEAQAKLLFEP